MVLESLLNPANAEDRPLHVFAISVVYTIIAVGFSLTLFPTQASILSVALITIIFVPFFQKLFEIEEEREDAAARRKAEHLKADNLFSRHKKVIYTFSSFFLGIIVAVSFIFLFFPPAEPAFALQTEALRGFSSSATGAATFSDNFSRFFLNNSQVMVLMFALSVMFGAGAVLILVWNASVIAVYAGLLAQNLISSGFSVPVAYLYGVPVGLGGIALHGIPEITAYFVAGLAGGILSVGLIREKPNSKELNLIMKDAVLLFLFAEFLIVIGAYLEAAL